MTNILIKSRFLILRRIVQLSIMALFFSANVFAWNILKGNLSSAKILDTVYIADPYMVLQTFAAGFISAVDTLIGALIVLTFYIFIGGRTFCSWICPMNVITDFAAFLRKKFSLNDQKKNVSVLRSFKYWILALSLILSLIFGIAAFEIISPISMLHRGIVFGFGMGWAAVLLIFLIDLVVLKNAWCGHLCPLGAFYTIINKFSLFKVDHIKEKCTNCNDCFIVCPEKQVLTGIIGEVNSQIYGSDCTNCGRCIEVCEDKALKFSVINYYNAFKYIKNNRHLNK